MPDLNQKSTYEFELPENQIATHPREPRDAARLLCLNGSSISHRIFRDIEALLHPGDLIVVNDVSVQKARFFVQRSTGGVVEVLLTDDAAALGRRHECLYKGSHVHPDEVLTAIGDDTVRVRLSRDSDDRASLCHVEFLGDEPVLDILDRIGQLPLPPYIVKRRKTLGDPLYESSDTEMYQTVYAKTGSAVAAPTAGLHFTDSLIERIRAKGVGFERLRLDVGTGTFRPVQTERLDQHVMHTEHYVVSQKLANAIEETKNRGGRVIAVGTTVVRSLEDQFQRQGGVKAGEYDTNIFIKPGYRFGIVDALVTNFHLPGSTLIVLVSAFAGYENTMAAYKEAVSEGYLFYSYGDAMFIQKRVE